MGPRLHGSTPPQHAARGRRDHDSRRLEARSTGASRATAYPVLL
uniref:Uncharacterized protein n=1 Tax=Fagus sylvatica TaxID=28930 RepID=A0A2N9G1X0_FAGSY